MTHYNPYVQNLIEMGYDEQDCRMVADTGKQNVTYPRNIHGRIFETENDYKEALADFINGLWQDVYTEWHCEEWSCGANCDAKLSQTNASRRVLSGCNSSWFNTTNSHWSLEHLRPRLMRKKPMKVLTLVFIVALVFSPGVRSLTANTLHTVADIISPNDWD